VERLGGCGVGFAAAGDDEVAQVADEGGLAADAGDVGTAGGGVYLGEDYGLLGMC
jgi:hypothetical protein